MPLTLAAVQVPGTLDAADWENAWAPYGEETYASALAFLDATDIVLDIGAGDLRFARMAAPHVKHLCAIEQRADLVPADVPENVTLLCGDARRVEFPRGITAAVLLMRHCQHFAVYPEKLERAGCHKLVTKARWGDVGRTD